MYSLTYLITDPKSYKEQKCAENYNKWHNNFFSSAAISIIVISNHNSFPGLFDKIASAYFIWKKCINILALEMACPGNRHCAGTPEFHAKKIEIIFQLQWKLGHLDMKPYNVSLQHSQLRYKS